MSDDLDAIMAIMEAAFEPRWGEAWSRRQVSDLLVMPGTHYRLVGADGTSPPAEGTEAAGFFLVRAAPGEEELLLVAVVPGLRGRGLGLRLLELFFADAAARGAQQVFLQMRENNPARFAYERAGLLPIGRRKAYYRTGGPERLDAITYGKQI